MVLSSRHSTDELLLQFAKDSNCKSSGAEDISRQALRDVLDNFLEVQDLVEDLASVESQKVNNSSDLAYQSLKEDYQNGFRRTVETIQAHEQAVFDLLNSACRCESPTQAKQLILTARREMLSLKLAVRAGFRHKGSLPRESFSPEDSVHSFVVPPSSNQVPNVSDCDDEQHAAGAHYEQKFVEEYASHLGSPRLKAYVTNCGMAAFSTVLHLLAHERSSGGVTIGLQPMYFENFHLLKRFFPQILLPEEMSPQDLTEFLTQNQPSVVFFDTVSNHGQAFQHNLDTILRWVRNCIKPAILVIDTTCQPAPLLPKNMLAGLAGNVSVLIIESLAKHHQFGLDLVTGGIILAHAEEVLQTDIRTTRTRFGTNLSVASADSLPRPRRAALTRRMEHHSRNVEFLAKKLEAALDEQPGVIESVTWLREGVEGDEYRTACFSITFAEKYRSLESYRDFQNAVLELARERNHPFALGTSFGFDVTRLFVTSPAVASQSPFLRIAVGTETRHELDDFLSILKAASTKMALPLEEKNH